MKIFLEAEQRLTTSLELLTVTGRVLVISKYMAFVHSTTQMSIT